MDKHIIYMWELDVDDLDTGDVFQYIKENVPESIAKVARQIDADELDAVDEFGPGSYWMYELGCTFRVTHFLSTITVELIK